MSARVAKMGIPELARVAVRGAVFVFAVHLTHRRVEIDCHWIGARSRAEAPRAPQRFADHPVELADMTERERPQERPQRRGSHHPEPQHSLRRPRAQHVRVIDMRTAREDRRDQRQHFAAR